MVDVVRQIVCVCVCVRTVSSLMGDVDVDAWMTRQTYRTVRYRRQVS